MREEVKAIATALEKYEEAVLRAPLTATHEERLEAMAQAVLAALAETCLIVVENQPGQERNAAEDLAMHEEATKYDYKRARWQNDAARHECLSALPYWIKQCLQERAKNMDLVARLEHIQEYWNGSRTDDAMSDALDEILHTCEAALEENPS
jgi:hypothetical protein